MRIEIAHGYYREEAATRIDPQQTSPKPHVRAIKRSEDDTNQRQKSRYPPRETTNTAADTENLDTPVFGKRTPIRRRLQ